MRDTVPVRHDGSGTADDATADWRDRAGFCGIDALEAPPGPLDLGQRARLRGLARSLKVAHDLVVVFAERYGAVPDDLRPAQLRQLVTVRALLGRYRLAEADAGLGPGHFAGSAAQHRYEQLCRRGRAGRVAAFEVLSALLAETAGTVDAALPQLAAPDVRAVYARLSVAIVRQRCLLQAWSKR